MKKKDLTLEQEIERVNKLATFFNIASVAFCVGVVLFIILAFVFAQYFIYFYTLCVFCGMSMMICMYKHYAFSTDENLLLMKQINKGFEDLVQKICDFERQVEKRV